MVNKKSKITILGISAFYHDSAAAILCNGEIMAAAHEERFTRIKHDPAFPKNAVKYCLKEVGLTLDNIDYVVFYDKPLIKLERLLETYLVHAPLGFRSFIQAAVVWIKEKFLLKSLIKKELKKICLDSEPILLFSDHHLSHAASAFYPSSFENAAILTIDGVGEWSTTSIYHGKGNAIVPSKEIHFPHSIGLLYSAFTYYLGFKVNSGEYKLMGLAPYGNHGSNEVQEYVKKIKENFILLHNDGSYSINQKYFNYSTGLTMTKDKLWEALFGFVRRREEDKIQQKHCDLALAIQQVTEELVIRLAKTAREITGEKYLVLAGGVALNCVVNNKLKLSRVFDDIWVQPAAGDAGGALGAALSIWYMYLQNKRVVDNQDSMKGSYLGPDFKEWEIRSDIDKLNLVADYIENYSELTKNTAKLISDGMVVGWFQGRMEWGPRALGNRSILGDSRNNEMQKKLNLRIKFREGFRPFAPAVLYEKVSELFTDNSRSPYMLFTTDINSELRNNLPKDYEAWDLYKKLYYGRSVLPAITHIDYSARHQTVHKETNPKFHQLITDFYSLTNCPAIINTSFNVRGEPIVCTPEDALRCFMNTDMDFLVIGNFILDKTKQTTKVKQIEFAAD